MPQACNITMSPILGVLVAAFRRVRAYEILLWELSDNSGMAAILMPQGCCLAGVPDIVGLGVG